MKKIKALTSKWRNYLLLAGTIFGLFTLVLDSYSFGGPHASSDINDKWKHFKTLPDDGVQWEWNGVKRVVAIGDLHGDFNALTQILTTLKLVDNAGHWTGGDTHLVISGDMIDGDPDGRFILDFLMGLQSEAVREGGMVHALIGNHEILVTSGDMIHMQESEERLFEGNEEHAHPKNLIREIFTSPKSIYADWLASLNAIIKINGKFFVHGGIDEWMLPNSPGAINSTVRAWIRYWQGRSQKPPDETSWTVGLEGQYFEGELGPIWHRGFKIKVDPETGEVNTHRDPDGPKTKRLERVLKHYKADGIVLGHAPTPDHGIHLEHPHYGGMVTMIDTHIAKIFGGQVTAREMTSDGGVVSHTFKRNEKPSSLFKKQVVKSLGPQR